ncbi:MAG: hypothetical protein A2Y10_03690 [Planctomycetes bacterium GWF2_41_51]|nr:MAG: hypothetical protein A2Y10_03690 [Planctomycetes bacterium GWF2_41_51]
MIATLPAIGLADSQSMRKLSIEEIKKFTCGAFQVIKKDKNIEFQRFCPKLQDYFKTNPTFDIRAKCTTGIVIRFASDTSFLKIKAKIVPKSPATGQIDILSNNKPITSLHTNLKNGLLDAVVPITSENNEMNIIEIYLPHYSVCYINEIFIEKKSGLSAAPLQDILLAFGDSITQGGGAYGPSQTAVSIAARQNNLSICNFGVGGYFFDANSLICEQAIEPRYIIVAFGTNDWSLGKSPNNARDYLNKLRAIFPHTKIIILEPLFRFRPDTDGANNAVNKNKITLSEYRAQLAQLVSEFDNMICVPPSRLLKFDKDLLSDGVHPTGEGYIQFGTNIGQILKTIFDE